MKTKRDVIEQALRLLEVAPVGDTASGEDYAEGERHFDALMDDLDDIYQLGLGLDVANLPNWAFMALAKATAGRAAQSFGLDGRMLEAKGLRKLTSYASNEVKTNQPPQVDYF